MGGARFNPDLTRPEEETLMPVNTVSSRAAVSNQGTTANLHWSRYAPHFDELCNLIPAYQENIDSLINAIPDLDLPKNPRICDLGAGTGNFIIALHAVLPDATFTHVDIDPVMNAEAKRKYAISDIEVTVIEKSIQSTTFDASSFDLIVCVNALCHAAPQVQSLRKMNTWLSRDGSLFLIDFGRPVRIADWGWYILKNAIKKIGILSYLKTLIKHSQAVVQNRQARKDQEEGSMWLHTTEEFEETLRNASFSLTQSRSCYRGYCDMAICKPD